MCFEPTSTCTEAALRAPHRSRNDGNIARQRLRTLAHKLRWFVIKVMNMKSIVSIAVLALAGMSLALGGCAAPDESTDDSSSAYSGSETSTTILGASTASTSLKKAGEKLAKADVISGKIYLGDAGKDMLAGKVRTAWFPSFGAADYEGEVSAKVQKLWTSSVRSAPPTVLSSDPQILHSFLAPTRKLPNAQLVYLDTSTRCVERLTETLKPYADAAILVESGADELGASADEIVVGRMDPSGDRLVPVVAKFVVDGKKATVGVQTFEDSTTLESALKSEVRRQLAAAGADYDDARLDAMHRVEENLALIVLR